MSFSFKLLLSSLLLAAALQAQNPAPAAPVREAKHKIGYLRFWNMLPAESGEFLLIKDNGTPEGEVLLSATPANYYASYVGLAAGRYSLKLVRAEAPDSVVERIGLTIRGEDSFTVLASAPDRKLKVETLEETYDPAGTPAGRLTIRQYFSNARVMVTVGARARSRELTPGEIELIDNLPVELLEVKMRATLPDGTTQNWGTEVNFKAIRHATLLILPDAKGRCRPRVALDGRAVAASPTEAPDQ
jgi:hypothetical protein